MVIKAYISLVKRQLGTAYRKRPLLANCLTYGSLSGGAELTQQTIRSQNNECGSKPSYDLLGVGRYTVMGWSVSPILYYWYRWLDTRLPGIGGRTLAKRYI